MGVPALFRWLSTKYPKIISSVIEEQPIEQDGVTIPVDCTGKNPNGEEQDNLYLDMNGIVHPCSHPEDRAPPETEEEMMMEIFKYTERVVAMVRPRKVLMLAIDGVAPRAKMNQQRSRRFRSAKEATEKEAEMQEFVKMLASKGTTVDDSLQKKGWDSNAITPGTPFMGILSISLKYWISYKLNTDPAWAKLKIIISDSSVPGEGEHKIMEFIRSQRGDPEHDPNTRHVIYGLDADLIMLGLATHEPHFRVIREDVFAADARQRICAVCNQKGHRAEECTGKAKVKEGEFDEKSNEIPKPFVWLHVGILREYLEVELRVPGLTFPFDLERALDDWVFMCFFVGNDFLPHLPSLEIRDQGIDTLISIWRENLNMMGGFLTKDGHVEMARAQVIFDGLGRQEDSIFRKRREVEERRDANAKRRKLEQEQGRPNGDSPGGQYRGKNERAMGGISELPINMPLFAANDQSANLRQGRDNVQDRTLLRNANNANKSAAATLKAQLLSSATATATVVADAAVETTGTLKRKLDDMEAESSTGTPAEPVDENADTVKLWEPGYRDRYYQQKFGKSPNDRDFRAQVGRDYVEGLAWVLLYYYQGCASWTWYYPHHYAPFAQDIQGISEMKMNFVKGNPFKPWEQLMAVLPAASKHNLPKEFTPLMTEPDSEIIDFYPEEFPIDLNGKKFAWQGVALLPFIDEKRLLEAVEKVYPTISEEELQRNTLGNEILLISEMHPLYDNLVEKLFSKKASGKRELTLDPRISEGLAGVVTKDPAYLPHSTLYFPLTSINTSEFTDLDDDRSLSIYYTLPVKKHDHKSMLLRGLKLNPPSLTNADIETMKRGGNRGGYGGRGGRGGGRGGYSYNGGGRDIGQDGYHRPPQSYAPPAGVRGPALNPGFVPLPYGQSFAPPPFPVHNAYSQYPQSQEQYSYGYGGAGGAAQGGNSYGGGRGQDSYGRGRDSRYSKGGGQGGHQGHHESYQLDGGYRGDSNSGYQDQSNSSGRPPVYGGQNGGYRGGNDRGGQNTSRGGSSYQSNGWRG